MATDQATLLRSLGEIIALTHDFVDSPGKFRMWALVMWLTTDMESQVSTKSDLLSYSLLHFQCEYGIVVYTMRSMQINANIAIPRCDENDGLLIDCFLDSLNQLSECMAINLIPLLTHIYVNTTTVKAKQGMFRPRVFVCNKTEATRISFDESNYTLSLHEATIPIDCTLKYQEDVAQFKPLFTICKQDPIDTIYWHKFGNHLIVFQNRQSDIIKPVPMQFKTKIKDFSDLLDSTLHEFVQSFNVSFDSAKLMRMCKGMLSNMTVPLDLRRFLFMFVSNRVGLDDELIERAGDAFYTKEHIRKDELVNIVCHIYGCMRCLREGIFNFDTVDLIRGMEVVAERYAPSWQTWLNTSSFIVDVIILMTAASVIKVACRHTPFAQRVDRVLASRVELWTREDELKAGWLVDHDKASDAVIEGYNNLCRIADKKSEDLHIPTCVQSSRRRRKRTTPKKKEVMSVATVAVEACAQDEEEMTSTPQLTTYHEHVRRMSDHYGFKCELVGSGIFFCAEDIDVVITVDDGDSLESAYERVCEITGWQMLRRPNGCAVAIIRGEWEGIRVDAQIWRGADASYLADAELDTQRALRVARELSAKSCKATRRDVRVLHMWASRMHVKGHVACMLPGIAITCLAVELGRRHRFIEDSDEVTLNRLLGQFDSVLEGARVVTFDDDDSRTSHHRALRVVVYGIDVCTRMTALTTNDVHDVVKASLRGCEEDDRDERMIRCGQTHMPIHLAATRLAKIARGFDGHPYLHSLHFDVQDDEVVRVWASVRCDAPVDIYGFRDSDRVWMEMGTDAVPETVMVERQGKQWSLAISPAHGRPTVSKSRATRVDDIILLAPDIVVPNLPSLSRDVMSNLQV